MSTLYTEKTNAPKSVPFDIEEEKKNLQKEIAGWFEKIKQHIENVPVELDSQVNLLRNIRKELYEDLNQLQHAAMILKAAETLRQEYPEVDQWRWHPKQTSDLEYADLTGCIGEEVFLNAEVTTSLRPVGTIDQRMCSTLDSLNKKPVKHFYFVATNAMFNRAVSKQRKKQYDIIIRLQESVSE